MKVCILAICLMGLLIVPVGRAFCAAEPITQDKPESSLKLYFKFDDGEGVEVRDYSASDNSGFSKGGVKWAKGSYGSGLEFNGEDGCVRLSDSLGQGDGSRSVEVWFTPATTSKAQACLFGNLVANPAPNTLGYCLNVERNRVVFQFANKEGKVVILSGGALKPGEWCHAVAVYDKSKEEIVLYVSGEEAGRTKVTGHKTSPYKEGVGYNAVSNIWYFAGIIRELKVYDRPLSTREVMRRYAVGAGGGVPAK